MGNGVFYYQFKNTAQKPISIQPLLSVRTDHRLSGKQRGDVLFFFNAHDHLIVKSIIDKNDSNCKLTYYP